MKTVLLFILLAVSVFVCGCGQPAPLPDPTNEHKTLPPGTKTNDVLLPINK